MSRGREIAFASSWLCLWIASRELVPFFAGT